MQAAAGATVTVNATPADGYAVDAITVNGGAVTVSGNTFVMPAAAVTVSVTFAESAMPDKLITFENGTLKTSYAPPVTVVLEDDMEWLADRVIKGNADNDKKIDILSARMGPLSGSNAVLQLTQPYAEPITRISYWVAGYGSDNMANVTLTVEVSTDGLQNWTPVETLTGAADITATMAEHVIETVPANAVYLRFVATSDAVTSRRVNLDNIGINLGEPIGVIKVNIAGNLSGTVNNQMSLEITLQNAIADDWWFTLKDPDNQDDYSYNWNAGTGEFLFTPSKVGNYTLTAEAVDAGDNPIASKTVTLAVSAATDVSIPPIVIVPGGFTFELPEGYTLANVYGADTVVEGDDFPWILLTSPTDYVVEGTTVTIKTDPAQRRLFRIFWQQ
ncbi:MAG: InlB B-repeat-containing protein [Kiritimatiellia bacterium]